MSCREGRAGPEMRSAKRTTLCRALQSWFVALLYHTEMHFYSHNSLRDTQHLKVFCLNNHVFLIVLVISYVHLAIMLDHLLFNESLLHYLSIMCVTMIVCCVCMNESVHLLYISIYFCSWRSYLWWALILHMAFSFPICIIMVLSVC